MSSDDETEQFQHWKGVPGTIVLINMFNTSNSETPKLSIAATCRWIKHHLRQTNVHYIAVCLYGADKPGTSNWVPQNICEIHPLNLPNLEDFNKVRSIDITAYGQSKDFIMSDALWHCSKMFEKCKKQLLSRTILLLTRLDVPPTQSDHNACFDRVMELSESNIDLKVINVADTDVKCDNFYEILVKNAWKNKEAVLPKPVYEIDIIVDMMYKQSHRHLANAQIYFNIGDKFDIGVGIYSLLKSNYQPKKEFLNSETNEIVTSVNKTMKLTVEENSENGVDENPNEQKLLPVLKSEILHTVEYGGERIGFSDTEKKMMYNPFGPPNMKLLGFKPAKIICKEKWYFKKGYFLFPNESLVEGSITTFKAFFKACIEMSVVAICVLCSRRNARTNIVALSPCSNPLGLDVEIGFDVIKIPFKENVRDLLISNNTSTRVTQEQKQTMKDIINHLAFDYKPQMFENPKLQSQYRAIETIALGEEETFTDTTITDPNKFTDLKEDLFEELFGPFKIIANKRPDTSGTTNAKRTKREKEIEIDENEFQNRLCNKTINLYTVDQLKHILNSKVPNYTIKSNLKKNDFVNLIYQHCS